MVADPHFHSLHDAAWTKRAGLRALTTALGADNIRWVGGAIRDSLLGQGVEDVDCATTHLPAAVMEKCQEAGIRTVPTGIDHGTITAVLEDGPVEITTLRRDVATDGRRATIAFAQEWQEDAARRDFTINALFAHPETLEISDYFGGLEDLAERRVRFIGDAKQRIREDHLRILRYFRFQARFGSQLDEEAEAACSELAETIKGLSRERVAAELFKLLELPDPGETLSRMRALGVLQVILPETCPPQLKALSQLIAAEQAQGFDTSAIRRLAALLPALPDIADSLAARLRMSRKQRAHLICVSERQPDDSASMHALAYREGTDCAVDRVLLAGADATPLKDWQVPQFPLKGGEIVERGLAVGPQVAQIRRAVEELWIAEGFPAHDRVQELLDQVARQSPGAAQ